jgi:exopolyphosphatase
MKTISSRLPPEYTRWILVDHNAMKGEMGKIYGKRLFGCIDHHAEENAVPRDCGAEPRIIRKCGSCTTLVVEYCKEAWNARARDNHNEAATYNSELAQMALGPILVDTSNLGNKAETTPADAQAVAYLESWIRSQYDRNEYFRIVSDAKQNIGGLILRDIFRKDYKQYDEGSLILGVSSITGGMRFLVDKAGGKEKFIGAISDFAKERGVSILSLMTKSNVDGQFARELLVWARDEKGASAAKKFEKDSTETLGLKQWGEGSLDVDEKNNWQRCWWQERVENSRKQVAPLMRNAITPLQRLNAL